MLHAHAPHQKNISMKQSVNEISWEIIAKIILKRTLWKNKTV